MRAAEDEGIDARRLERGKVLLRHGEQLVAPGHARFDELDEARAGGSEELQVGRGDEGVIIGAGADRADGTDHADAAVAGVADGAAHGGLDDLDHGDATAEGVALAGVPHHRGGGSVASDDQQLRALIHEGVERVEGVGADIGERLGSVGRVGGVAEVDDRLVLQLVDHGAGDGEPADSGVEDAQG